MRPHRTSSSTRPDTPIYINDSINDSSSNTPTSLPICRVVRFPTALLALALILGLAILVMLGTWLSLATRATTRVTTFVAHSEEQTLSTDELEDISLPPAYIVDLLTRF